MVPLPSSNKHSTSSRKQSKRLNPIALLSDRTVAFTLAEYFDVFRMPHRLIHHRRQ